MWCNIIMCIVHIVNMIRNGAMLIVECMKRKIHDHFAKSPEYHFYKYYCYASHLSLTSAIITMFALQMSLKTTSRLAPNCKLVLKCTYPTLKNIFFEKGRKFVFYNPWFVVPYTRVYCTGSGILPVVCCTISTDSAQVKINFIHFLQYCMIACKGHICMDP